MPEVLKRVGRFDLLEVVGRGGAAVVYLALQRDLQRHVALKELAPFHLADSTFAERFVEESRLAGAMNHPNVVTVHEYFEDGGVPYIAMEYLPHGSLRQYIGRVSPTQIAGVLEGVLSGLAHGEAHGIVHRDLKPENLLVAADGRVKIADFGVARAYSKAAKRAVVTVTGTTIGTPSYMSPEQALGSDLTPATDLYSLGIVAWELLAGHVPFDEPDTPVAVLYRHVHEPIPSVRTVAPDVDEGIASWLEKMLAKRPEDRYQSADDAWIALEDVVLDLFGPRWRREARLPVDEGSTTSTAGPLTPPDEEPARNPPGPYTPPPLSVVSPERPIADTVDGAPAADPHALAAEQAQVTVPPARRRRLGNTTMMRIARRHRELAEDEASTRPNILRRRLIALAILATMAAGAVGGVILAQPRSSHHGPTRAQREAAERAAAAREAAARVEAAANQQLTGIVQQLGRARNIGVTAMDNATTPAAQAKDAAAVQRAYSHAADEVTPLVSKTAKAPPLLETLTKTASAYGRLATAARAHDQHGWAHALDEVRANEKRLREQVAAL